jgi:hypothetical protein
MLIAVAGESDTMLSPTRLAMSPGIWPAAP